ncbi:putative universal stress protein UspA [Photobacterium gaetbulicola Gung47]|uniref:Universal stress protein n=2 Tax=Photobacterium gaetbulicola TaxID=1295392 RepID=A0A0C5X3P4_9GAMM|nr:putative universal stress protein UspA [Photobacterium gaetbulicola Gung47]
MNKERSMYKQILVPVDLNEKGFADKAVELAVWHAKHSNATIHLLNVLPGIHMAMVSSYFPKDAARKMMQDTQQQLKAFAEAYIPPEIVHHQYVSEGKTWTTILDHAERVGADLIIMPSHKRSGIDRVMLGSVAAKVVENSPINVLVLKPQGHLSERA